MSHSLTDESSVLAGTEPGDTGELCSSAELPVGDWVNQQPRCWKAVRTPLSPTRCFPSDGNSPEDALCHCFYRKQTRLKNLKAATKRNCHSLNSCEQDNCQLQHTNPFRKHACMQAAPLMFLSAWFHSLPALNTGGQRGVFCGADLHTAIHNGLFWRKNWTKY